MNEKMYVVRDAKGKLQVMQAGKEFLRRLVTDPDGNVYMFHDEAPSLEVAVAMARLSRSSNDMRVIYLDEFAENSGNAAAVAGRVVTGFGDDSVQQLLTLRGVVEGASNLLTKLLEWGRFMSYLEQSTRYIFFDERDENGRYKYFIPTNLPEDLRNEYSATMDQVFDRYSEIVRGLTTYVRSKNSEPSDPTERQAWLGATRAQACDAARPLLPVATKSTVGIVGSTQGIESLVRHLLAHPLQEARDTGRILLREARKVAADFLKRADMPDRGLDWVLYMQETDAAMHSLGKKYCSSIPRQTKNIIPVNLLDYFPKNELDLVSEMLFSFTDLSVMEIEYGIPFTREIEEEIFSAYIGNRRNRRHKPGRVLELAHYEWEIVSDYGIFRDLQRHRVVDAWEWQKLTCNYGYDVPDLVHEAGFEDLFRSCFALAEQLWQKLRAEGFEEEAQYATLLGHKMRYRFMMNARESFHLLELRTQPAGHPGYRKICQEMYQQLSAVHPRIGAAMTFINKNADAPLTRFEEERATQLKTRLQLSE